MARNWHVDVASFLVERGAEVNRTNVYGRTPLHVAASANNVEIIEFLIQKGGEEFIFIWQEYLGDINKTAY